MFGLIARLFGGKILEKGVDLVGSLVGQKGKREEASQALDAKVTDQYAAESLQQRENRTWFDSLVDGLNRLIRPTGFALTVWIFIWPIRNMEQFQQAMVAYELIPVWLAGLIVTVWSLFFGGRFITKDMFKDGFKGRSKKEFQEILSKQKEIHEVPTNMAPVSPVIPQVLGIESKVQQESLSTDKLKGQSTSQLRDALESDKPLSLPSIVEWNKRNNPTFQGGGRAS